jgi:ankyrin repeat protein
MENHLESFLSPFFASVSFPVRGALARRARHALAAVCALAALLLAGAAVATPLDSMVKAVKFDDIKAVRKLLAQGADPNASDSYGIPLIVLAAREKSDQVATALLDDKRTDPDRKDGHDQNALMLAALNKDETMVHALIERGAEVNKQGWAPLHYAATSGADSIVSMLLEASAYIDAASPNGTTPLMMAARGGFVSTVQLLLDQGADPTLRNQIGLTAADFARRYNQKDLAQALDERSAQVSTRRAAAASSVPAATAAP